MAPSLAQRGLSSPRQAICLTAAPCLNKPEHLRRESACFHGALVMTTVKLALVFDTSFLPQSMGVI